MVGSKNLNYIFQGWFCRWKVLLPLPTIYYLARLYIWIKCVHLPSHHIFQLTQKRYYLHQCELIRILANTQKCKARQQCFSLIILASTMFTGKFVYIRFCILNDLSQNKKITKKFFFNFRVWWSSYLSLKYRKILI